MKYQQVVCARKIPPNRVALRQFYVPVHLQDGKWLPCGPMREEFVPPATMFGNLSDYEHMDDGSCGPLSDITPPDGWVVAARTWLHDDYVPESQEVLEEKHRRAMTYLRSLGVYEDD